MKVGTCPCCGTSWVGGAIASMKLDPLYLAAPDLLEALEAFTSIDVYTVQWATVQDLRQKADAAIAKAKGKA